MQELFQLCDCSHGGKFADEQLHLLLHMISELQLMHTVLNMGQPCEGMCEKMHKSSTCVLRCPEKRALFKCHSFCCAAVAMTSEMTVKQSKFIRYYCEPSRYILDNRHYVWFDD